MPVKNFRNILRNAFCSTLAMAVIASGYVRRAKKKAFNRGVITAIYFHNPNELLFSRCIDWLTRNGYTFISDEELIRILYEGATPPSGAVWLSFDDGFKELLTNVIPVVRQRHVPITLFVPSGIIEGLGLFPWLHKLPARRQAGESVSTQNGTRDSITVTELKEVSKVREVRIGSHTVRHTVTMGLTDAEASFEFGESRRAALESWTGESIRSFAYPEGRLSGSEGRWLRRARLSAGGYH